MKIMSFNTQHCMNFMTKEIDYKIMAEAILQCSADVVGLNEMRNQGDAEGYEPQTALLSALTAMPHQYFAEATQIHGRNPYGNAMLSKYRMISAETIPVPDPDPDSRMGIHQYETRCLLKAKLENGVTIMVIHFGLNEDEKQNAVKTVIEHLENEKCILMGDFNLMPDSPLLDPIRARMKDTADVFTSPKLSFPSDNPYRKIDYIFVSHDIKIVSADIPAIVASDHRPHIAEVYF